MLNIFTFFAKIYLKINIFNILGDLMEIIKRPHYLQRLIPMINTEFIKVITGVRRSGKSYLLLMLKNYLLEHSVSEQQVVYLNFEYPQYHKLLNYDALFGYLEGKVNTNEKTYLLFDEIQEVKDWQKLINGLRAAYNVDIYITGSNASLLSGELATYLTGRYVEIKMMPLSFDEYLKFKNIEHAQEDASFSDYLKYGGFPSVVLQTNAQLKMDVLSGIYDSVLLRDVDQRANIRNKALLSNISDYLLNNIGQLTNPGKIANTLKSKGLKVNRNTIESYLKLLEDAFLFYKAPRYDIRGKEYLEGPSKYYVVDLGFIDAELHKSKTNMGARIENLVYLALREQGYNVFVGQFEGKEIDFVATDTEKTLYVQVTDHIPENSTRETDNLLHIPTGYQKIVVTNRKFDEGMIDGIPIVYITDFLKGKF